MNAIVPSSLGLTSTQKGKIWESMACAGLMLESQGRLAPFVPMADDGGFDAIVYDKVTSTRSIRIDGPPASLTVCSLVT